MASKKKPASTGKKKGAMRNLKGKRETLTDKDARRIKGGLTLNFAKIQ
jgi:hypothetical protein